MSTQVQRRKGTTSQHSTFTGASAELTVDSTKNTIVVHDGTTAGGFPLAKETGSALSVASLTVPGGTANGVPYLNASKVLTSGSALVFDGANLGVGTASPGYRLDVLSTSSSQLRLQNTDATSYASMLFTGTGRSFSMGVGNASETGIGVANQFFIYDNTAGQTRLRLDASGNLGLGVTPSASTLCAIELGDPGNGISRGNTNNLFINQGVYYNAGNKYAITGSQVGQYNLSAGSHRWFTAPSGTAGAAIAFTQAMTLDGSSNLAVAGTISPRQATTAAAPPYVKGAMYFDTTLNKLRIGGATAWETVTSV